MRRNRKFAAPTTRMCDTTMGTTTEQGWPSLTIDEVAHGLSVARKAIEAADLVPYYVTHGNYAGASFL